MSLRNLAATSALISAVVYVQMLAPLGADAAKSKTRKITKAHGPVAGAVNINAQGSSFVDPLLTDAAQHNSGGGTCTSNFPTTGKNGWFNVYGQDLPSGSVIAGGFAGNQAPSAAIPFGAGPVVSNLAMSYGAIGSGGGKTAFYAAAPNNTGSSPCEYVSGPYAFSGTDNPYSLVPTDAITVANAGGAQVIQVPSTIGAVGLIYNSKIKLTAGRVNSLGETVPSAASLSRKEVCAIYSQSITDWHDIDPANPVNSTIKLEVRSGSSGTTLIFARHLQANCGNGPWTLGGNPNNNAATWSFPLSGLVDATLTVNKDVADKVKSTKNTTGFVDAALGKLNGNKIAKVQNKSGNYIAAGSAGILAAFAGAQDIDTTLPGHESRIELGIPGNPTATWDPSSAKAYPIAGATYFWFYGLNGSGQSWYDTNPNFDAGTRTALKDFVTWYTVKGGTAPTSADQIIKTVTGYGPLPGGVSATGTCPASPTATDIKCQIRKLINNSTFGI